jgi:pimeloyl-ACP methyl ester carboxylesterase
MLARWLKWILLALLPGAALLAGALGFRGTGRAAATLLIFLLADAPLLAVAYALSWRPRSAIRETGGLAALASGLREWAAFKLFYLVLQPFESFWMGDDLSPGETPGGTPVLLIHGYFCNRGLWFWMRGRLRAAGFRVATVNLEPVFGDIEDFAEALHARIEAVLAQTGAQKLVLAAHSMGGLVARAYLRRHGEARVAALVTLGTPHAGSALAPWALGRDGRQMEPGNAWLDQLNATAIALPVTSVASAGDEFVAPQESALLPGARQILVAGQDHFGLALSDRAFSIIRDAAGGGLTAP